MRYYYRKLLLVYIIYYIALHYIIEIKLFNCSFLLSFSLLCFVYHVTNKMLI